MTLIYPATADAFRCIADAATPAARAGKSTLTRTRGRSMLP